ncbi:hypothetical protein CDD82_5425 [Ophiocordyceps australis]|uniref:Putative transcription factor kapC n=1 Tax=Ophiocordyceps australis TaxID=1399860 RepID=A0A2C5ZRE6_9HYPO|nr:hypothetical protein CDD82_5425 [Ophiocordyceps australis]
MMSAPPPAGPGPSPGPGLSPGPPGATAGPPAHTHVHPHPHAHAAVSAPLSVQPPDNSLAHAAPGSVMSAAEQADGRKAKRELSQSKRAAQNRAAQRAFRQRKEGYIKKLEQQVREYAEMESTYKSMQSEGYALREYIIHLQSRLLDLQGEFPQPPPNINLSNTGPPPSQPSQATPSGLEQDSPEHTNDTPLEAVAQAVAGLTAHQQQMSENQQNAYANRGDEDTRTAEEINRQLQEDGNATRQP